MRERSQAALSAQRRRVRERRLRKLAAGICESCSRPRCGSSPRCFECLATQRLRARERNGAKPGTVQYGPEGRPDRSRTCETCGTRFLPRNTAIPGWGRFCSRACVSQARRNRADDPLVRADRRARVIAHSKVAYALHVGRITRGACEDCGSTSEIHGHHEDYSLPLNVVWLCRYCHGRRHGWNTKHIPDTPPADTGPSGAREAAGA